MEIVIESHIIASGEWSSVLMVKFSFCCQKRFRINPVHGYDSDRYVNGTD